MCCVSVGEGSAVLLLAHTHKSITAAPFAGGEGKGLDSALALDSHTPRFRVDGFDTLRFDLFTVTQSIIHTPATHSSTPVARIQDSSGCTGSIIQQVMYATHQR